MPTANRPTEATAKCARPGYCKCGHADSRHGSRVGCQVCGCERFTQEPNCQPPATPLGDAGGNEHVAKLRGLAGFFEVLMSAFPAGSDRFTDCIRGIHECRAAADEIEKLAARPCVEICQEERALGNGGCGACALCCKEANEHADALAQTLNEISKGDTAEERCQQLARRVAELEAEVARLRQDNGNEQSDLDAMSDPTFTGGLSPSDYLDKFHEGELTPCSMTKGCQWWAGHRGECKLAEGE